MILALGGSIQENELLTLLLFANVLAALVFGGWIRANLKRLGRIRSRVQRHIDTGVACIMAGRCMTCRSKTPKRTPEGIYDHEQGGYTK